MTFITARSERRVLKAMAPLLISLLAGVGLAPPAAAAVTLPPGTIPVPESGTFLYLFSEPGDFVGQGVEQLYTSADSTFTSFFVGDSFFRASVQSGDYEHSWLVDLVAPDGQPLVVGSYTGAESASFPRSPGAPGLDVYGDGRGCGALTGQFDVTEVSLASTGEVLTFDATFEQRCEGFDPALFGRIRIENPPPPPDLTPPVLYLPGDMTLEAFDASGRNVFYDVSAYDSRDPNPTVACTPASGSFFPVGSTTVTCTATDQSGNVATGTFVVHVLEIMTFGIDASTTGQVDGSGNVPVSGTVSCSRDAAGRITGRLTQLFANRVTISGDFRFEFNCTAPQSPWSVVVVGDNGKFAPGNATLTINAWACDPYSNCHSDSLSQGIRLSGGKR
jgi:HYR domain